MQSQIENDSTETNELYEQNQSRRSDLQTAGLLAGGAIIGGALISQNKTALADDMMNKDKMMDNGMMPSAMASAVFGDLVNFKTDVDILNYALLLEYLESEYYIRAVAANDASPFLKGMTPMIAQKLRDDEVAHVAAVTQRITDLGGTPVTKPGFMFPPDTMRLESAFLEFAKTLEETGVHAYLGAAPAVRDNAVLRFAASVYGIEARHTALIRHATGRLGAPDALETPLPGAKVAELASPYFVMG